MTSCKGNVIEAVLQTIALCGEHEAALRNHQADAELLRERALDMMQDIEQHLCQLAATFTTAPMCGRIFTPLPHEHTSEQERLESLQLRCALTVRTDEPTSTNCKPTAGQTHLVLLLRCFCVLRVSQHAACAGRYRRAGGRARGGGSGQAEPPADDVPFLDVFHNTGYPGSLRRQNEDALLALSTPSPRCVKSETCCTRGSSCKL
jgi:hypothetical protein